MTLAGNKKLHGHLTYGHICTCSCTWVGLVSSWRGLVSAGFLTLRGVSADTRNKTSPHLRMRQGI